MEKEKMHLFEIVHNCTPIHPLKCTKV